MGRIVLFIYQYRAFFTFLVLEFFCSWMFIENNQYQGASFFNSSNSFVASVNGFSQGVREYFSLREINEMLAEENTQLRRKLEQRNQSLHPTGVIDSAIIKFCVGYLTARRSIPEQFPGAPRSRIHQRSADGGCADRSRQRGPAYVHVA